MSDDFPFSGVKGIILALVVGLFAVGFTVLVIAQLKTNDPMYDRSRFRNQHPSQPGQFEIHSLGPDRNPRPSPPPTLIEPTTQPE